MGHCAQDCWQEVVRQLVPTKLSIRMVYRKTGEGHPRLNYDKDGPSMAYCGRPSGSAHTLEWGLLAIYWLTLLSYDTHFFAHRTIVSYSILSLLRIDERDGSYVDNVCTREMKPVDKSLIPNRMGYSAQTNRNWCWISNPTNSVSKHWPKVSRSLTVVLLVTP